MNGLPGTVPPGPDQGLLARLQSGDEAAFTEVLLAWSPGMHRVARSFVSTEELAADVVQDTWLAMIEGIDRFEGRSSVKTWVYRILMNTAQRRGARESRIIPWSSAQDAGPTVKPDRFQAQGEQFPGHWREFPAPWPTADARTPELLVLAGETMEQLRHALADLPDRQRVVITLRDVEGFSAAEVVAVLEISPANQRVLLHRARAFVRSRLEQYFAGAVETDQPRPGCNVLRSQGTASP